MIPANIDWNDLGSWNALYEKSKKDQNKNAILSENVKTKNTEGCLVRGSTKKKIALIGVKDLAVIETEDTILIVDRAQDQLVKEILKEF